jgi:hypothetical protein
MSEKHIGPADWVLSHIQQKQSLLKLLNRKHWISHSQSPRICNKAA